MVIPININDKVLLGEQNVVCHEWREEAPSRELVSEKWTQQKHFARRLIGH